jgi:hypothetical protein
MGRPRNTPTADPINMPHKRKNLGVRGIGDAKITRFLELWLIFLVPSEDKREIGDPFISFKNLLSRR